MLFSSLIQGSCLCFHRFASALFFCWFGERTPAYLQPFSVRKSELRMQNANWSLFIPAGLAEGGKNIEQRLQRWWMERIKNFLNSLEEALTTRSLNVLHVNEVGNAGGGWMQRLRLFTSMKVRRIRLRASHRSVRTFGRTGEGEGRWGEQLGFSKIWMSKF